MVETNLPVMFLRDNVLFPYSDIRVEIFRDKDKEILDNAAKYNDNHMLLINLFDPLDESPDISSLPNIGVVGRIKSKLKLSNGNIRVVISGLERVSVINYFENDNRFLESFVIPICDEEYEELEATALRRVLFKEVNKYIEMSSSVSNSVLGRIVGIEDISKLTDIICFELPFDYAKKLNYLRNTSSINRIRLLIEDIDKEIETVNLENEIELSLKEKIDASQREFLLREKIRIIKEELGETAIKDIEIESLRKRIEKKVLPDKVRKRLLEEFKRYQLLSEVSPEVTIIRTYIEWLLDLPWCDEDVSDYKVNKVNDILNDSHYGLEYIKTRIAEFVMVMDKIHDNSTIICLVGPPGVGKTTLAKSIANSLNKKFVKISVGGVSDEAEIMGHRRTYLGANPGKIIQGMKKVGVNNPVFLIDEVDKINKDYRGDPTACLLDVLDREQNKYFCDNYIEEEFDLSHVLFILTANDISLIPSALRDRLEIIELSSYTNFDKKEIAKKYLIPKLFKKYKIRDYNISINDFAINKIIEDYTKEAGARELERKIEQICRKVIFEDIHDEIVKVSNLKNFLGPIKYYHQKNDSFNKSGIINALAYTIYGGDILKVSATYYKGTGKVKVTGTVGKVMEESVEVALSYIKSNASSFEIDEDLFNSNDFHIHIEEGATPKDGPSAGVTIVTTLLSLLKNKVISNDVGMTGEMTLRGKILPVGGIKEKLISASVNGIKKVFIPVENNNLLDVIPKEVKEKLEIILVRDYLDIYYYLFSGEK